MRALGTALLGATLLVACAADATAPPPGAGCGDSKLASSFARVDAKAGESHLLRIRQLTDGGANAEPSWSFDGRSLIFRSTRDGAGCDRVFTLDLETGEVAQLTSTGRAAGAAYLPDSERVLFASTQGDGGACPPEPDTSEGDVWPLHAGYDVYTAERDGSGVVNITNSPGYDAEASVSRSGRIVFTSDRSGDLELWTMDTEGGGLTQLTDTPGYDGGASFSRDGSKIVWLASRFETEEEVAEYRVLLDRGLVRPTDLDVYVMNADGTDARRLTENGAANFGPCFTPDGQHVLFTSNLGDGAGAVFDIYEVGLEGGEPERVTYSDASFDGFPAFSWGGGRVAFASNRDTGPDDMNLFVADWRP